MFRENHFKKGWGGMTIEECRKRKREYKRMLQNIELIRLSLLRSIACEDLNIADLKKKEGGKDER